MAERSARIRGGAGLHPRPSPCHLAGTPLAVMSMMGQQAGHSHPGALEASLFRSFVHRERLECCDGTHLRLRLAARRAPLALLRSAASGGCERRLNCTASAAADCTGTVTSSGSAGARAADAGDRHLRKHGRGTDPRATRDSGL